MTGTRDRPEGWPLGGCSLTSEQRRSWPGAATEPRPHVRKLSGKAPGWQHPWRPAPATKLWAQAPGTWLPPSGSPPFRAAPEKLGGRRQHEDHHSRHEEGVQRDLEGVLTNRGCAQVDVEAGNLGDPGTSKPPCSNVAMAKRAPSNSRA